jgi:hypothetical protein
MGEIAERQNITWLYPGSKGYGNINEVRKMIGQANFGMIAGEMRCPFTSLIRGLD